MNITPSHLWAFLQILWVKAPQLFVFSSLLCTLFISRTAQAKTSDPINLTQLDSRSAAFLVARIEILESIRVRAAERSRLAEGNIRVLESEQSDYVTRLLYKNVDVISSLPKHELPELYRVDQTLINRVASECQPMHTEQNLLGEVRSYDLALRCFQAVEASANEMVKSAQSYEARVLVLRRLSKQLIAELAKTPKATSKKKREASPIRSASSVTTTPTYPGKLVQENPFRTVNPAPANPSPVKAFELAQGQLTDGYVVTKVTPDGLWVHTPQNATLEGLRSGLKKLGFADYAMDAVSIIRANKAIVTVPSLWRGNVIEAIDEQRLAIGRPGGLSMTADPNLDFLKPATLDQELWVYAAISPNSRIFVPKPAKTLDDLKIMAPTQPLDVVAQEDDQPKNLLPPCVALACKDAQEPQGWTVLSEVDEGGENPRGPPVEEPDW